MTREFKVTDTETMKAHDAKTYKDVIRFMVVQTANLLIETHLSTNELMMLQWLEHNSGETLLLNRFAVTSKIGA